MVPFEQLRERFFKVSGVRSEISWDTLDRDPPQADRTHSAGQGGLGSPSLSKKIFSFYFASAGKAKPTNM